MPAAFPWLKGKLGLRPGALGESAIYLEAEYDMPLHFFGKLLDAALMPGVARRSLENFIGEIGVGVRGTRRPARGGVRALSIITGGSRGDRRAGPDCCIVGGGPAGMMAGLLLARAGVARCVLEKHADFLRDFRGDTIHPSTLDVMDELGLLERFLQRPHQEVTTLAGNLGDAAA